MSPEKKNQIKEFIDSLNKQEQAWTNGYLDGILNAIPAAESLTPKKLQLLMALNPATQKKLPTYLPPVPNRKVFMQKL
jgi:hypothetical protein